ncbi:HD domain-containing protein [Ruminococcus sp. OA3]|uniref:HD domain-containing protein n=1 Tax=Ruminococcus sp. OA3 TaxID=2914164 RepID=UPI001F070AAA|nr:HD domain-containing protein [Ruminococcus sp. OA3]MCH1982598.1 HD domain-containing protein [Ruminococcus sp. OA3]
MNERLEKQAAFMLEADKAKNIFRQTHLSGHGRNENDAEHSWHMALMAFLLSEHANQEVDQLRVIKMLLIHDLVEIDAGDTYAYDDAGNETKRQREEKAADRIFGLLPEDQERELRELWEEFEAYETPEALFAHVLDNFQPLTLNDANGGNDWKEHQVKKSQILKRNEKTEQGSAGIWKYMKQMIERNVEAGAIIDE